MNVKFLDLKRQYKSIKEPVDNRIKQVMDSQQFINGEQLKEFEKRLAKLVNKKYAVGVSSGTAALFLAYKAHGMKKDWNVLSQPNTFIATTETITASGANVHFSDVKLDGSIDVYSSPKDVKFDAIVPVHLYGKPVNVNEVNQFAKEHDAIVIEDACQAINASFGGKKLPYNSTGCFSFYPGKNLGTIVDAGAVVTDNEYIAERVRMLRDHGRTEKYKSEVEGYNFRMNEISAAVLNTKITHIKEWTEKRQMNAKLYTDLIIDYNIPVEPPEWEIGTDHVFHLYVIRCKKRGKLKDYLGKKGIETGIHYPIPLHKQPAYQRFNHIKLPVAEKLSKEILSLPMYPELKETEIRYVVNRLRRFYS